MDLGWLTYLWIIPVLGVLVFVHELGHFVTARLNGIRVDEFGFGFPPRLFGIRRGNVLYSINALPIGGFVKIYGENGENADEPDAFGSKKPWQRAAVLAAGTTMNLLLAVIIFSTLAVAGLPSERGAKVGEVAPGSPAATAGIRAGDKIASIDGSPVARRDDVSRLVAPRAGTQVTMVLDRNGQQVTVRLTPRLNPPPGQGAMGVRLEAAEVVTERHNPLSAIGVGVRETGRVLVLMVTGLSTLITGGASGEGLVGPVGIAQATGEIANTGQWRALLDWTALLSLNLFLVNLLPLPALDGGRLVFVLIEAVRGKKVPPQREAVVHAVGMMLLLTFMVLISFFDVQRILGGGSVLP